jgi:uncharacterized protein (DUF1778 family)
MATHPAIPERRTEKLDLRISPSDKATLQAAAAAKKKPLSEFVLESALVEAEIALADQTTIKLNAEQWTAFIEALDAPPRELPALKALFEKPGFFDQPVSQKKKRA